MFLDSQANVGVICENICVVCHDLTTYDYIVLEREKAEKRAREKDLEKSDANSKKAKVITDMGIFRGFAEFRGILLNLAKI